jgi:hypothetical protein
MFNFFKSKRKTQPEDFESFMMNEGLTNPTINIEDVLEKYIAKYNLSIRKFPDEPDKAVTARTKLQILEGSIFADPKDCPDPQFQNYLQGLRSLVQVHDTMSPELRKRMKEKEKIS